MLPALKIMRSDDREDVDGAVRLGLHLHGVFLGQGLLLALLTAVLGDLHIAQGASARAFVTAAPTERCAAFSTDIFVQATTCRRSHDRPDAASHATRASQANGLWKRRNTQEH